MARFRRVGELAQGVYDEVISAAVAVRLEALRPGQVTLELIEPDEGAAIDAHLLTVLRDAAQIALASRTRAADKLALAAKLLLQLGEGASFMDGELQLEPRILRAITPLVHDTPAQPPSRPRGSLLTSDLLTNAQGDSVLDHLASELDSADRVDLLCAFIKLSGLDRLGPLLERHTARGRPLRVLTTTYMRATEQKALDRLVRLGAKVRVSYDEGRTRLHAKAWVFHRESGYSTAYVGSSNLSHAAQTEGLEWNVRVAAVDQPALVASMASLFESYWADPDKFEVYDGTAPARARLAQALVAYDGPATLRFDLEPKEWQRPMLRELEEARAAGRHQNLVVAATGTGKTLVAAFDYEALRRAGTADTLLFVAHRKEILEQARAAFRAVLGLPSFGEFWVDGQTPVDHRHVFASIQSLAGAALDPAHYSHVVIDEVHHAAAASYDALLKRLRPVELVGLSATPERADGRLYAEHFPPPYVGNLRVWNAIPHVLVPFRYFVLDVDGLDLAEVKWDGGYVEADLSRRLIGAAEVWLRTLTRALETYVARPERVRALAFCVDTSHARVVAERLQRDLQLKARALTHDTPSAERAAAKADLQAGRVQVLCVVDLFNEGVDIPDVNTLFLLRPTESATVFLQQLGRGLRRSRDKDVLTVFDLTGRQHPNFRFDRHLRGLLGHTPRELNEFVRTGAGRLPSGCVVHLEERAQADLLERLRRAVPTDRRALREVLAQHRDAGWSLADFLAETEADPLDVYRKDRSWTALRAEVGLGRLPDDPVERAALARVPQLLEVDDPLRLDAWTRLVNGEAPRTERERRLAAMLWVVLYDAVGPSRIDELFELWRTHGALREELGQLIPVLRARSETLPRGDGLSPDVPLMVHARYGSLELAAAFAEVTQRSREYRPFYTGVEAVAGGRHDLLLVTLEKGDVRREHLRYRDYPLNASLFHWQSQATTRQEDRVGQRHVRPAEAGVVPLLFARETKKDERGLTRAFRFLGAVEPVRVDGERPISIEWRLATPLRAEWVERWSNVG